MKTARFTEIVASCGAPSVHLTWVPPAQDSTLKTALKQSRVMTIHQNVRGSTKDYGTVGLLQTPHAQILVFPRSLKRFAERRIVGIDYSLLALLPEKAGKNKAAPRNLTPKSGRADGRADDAPRSRERAELVPFGTRGAGDADGDEEAGSHVSSEVPQPVEKPPERAAPLTWEEAARQIARARKALQKRHVAAARDQLLELENRIRTTGKLSPEA